MIPFSEKPGRHERHFKRKLNNSLFPRPIWNYSDDDLLEVQRLDHEELLDFIRSLKALVYRASQLKPNEETQVIIDLKIELEKHYERACSLADEQGNNKEAIRYLIETIMQVMRRNAVGDSLAEQELATETLARQTHFELLEYPLIADLLHENSLIQPDELVPVLLTDPEDQVKAALELFDPEQRLELARQAEQLIHQKNIDDPKILERLNWYAV